MKLKDNFILRDVAGQTVVLPADDVLNLNTMVTLNDTGKFLWERLETETTVDALVDALLSEYEVDEPTARVSVENFTAKLYEHGFLC